MENKYGRYKKRKHAQDRDLLKYLLVKAGGSSHYAYYLVMIRIHMLLLHFFVPVHKLCAYLPAPCSSNVPYSTVGNGCGNIGLIPQKSCEQRHLVSNEDVSDNRFLCIYDVRK
ncbi:hypothetical protein TNCV_2470471 [Trichonephila clavipes]|nr:hypothetical protein TNCV_2470471 [Trichonephila clavipes]